MISAVTSRRHFEPSASRWTGAIVAATLLILAAVAPPPVSAATFHVGAGMDCDSNTLGGGLFLAALNGPGEDTIYIANNQSYTAVEMFISNQNVRLIGGVDDCSDLFPSGVTVLDGTGGNSKPVIEYRETDGGSYSHTINHLEIRGGETGGISIDGAVRLVVHSATIQQNLGSGVSVTGPEARLTLEDQTFVHDNQATRGGGVACTNAFLGLQGSIHDNTATLEGGGLHLDGCEVQISGREHSTIEGNMAAGGGGFHAVDSVITILGSHRGPVRIQGNTSTGPGGGFSAMGSSLTIGSTWIQDNDAVGGGGGAAFNDSTFVIRPDGLDLCLLARCSKVSGNSVTDDPSGADGAAFLLESLSSGIVEGTYIEGNEIVGPMAEDGRGSVALIDTTSDLRLDGVVLAGNLGPELFYLDGHGSDVTAWHITSVDNQAPDGSATLFHMAFSGASVTVSNSVVYDPFFFSGVSIPTIDGLLTPSDLGLVGSNIVIGDAQFTNTAIGDYSLTEMSAAIDASSSSVSSNADILGTSRDQVIHDAATPIDFGAYEYTGNGIFDDGFESGDVLRWSASIGGTSGD